ncbi:hypothetical protein A9C19_20735 (plasmid) [Bacillus weihaiensis]|uniref:Uncharacterized protein n=2 Tax=Bacillus weihaiensis TaxID=1547283 RepID=A0A1L3MY04_9BACI|nr:hypothetical protein A9C19_20735 [Bacillus weihaiensis]
MKLIDENQYFVESNKVIQVVLDNESLSEKKLKAADKLQLVKEQKTHTTSPEEYEELEMLEKELERKIRFNQLKYPAVPEDLRETVKRNAAVEQLEVDNTLNELKAELKDRVEYLESELLPLLDNIRKLESLKKVPDQIDFILKAEMGEGVSIPVSLMLRTLSPSNNEGQAGKALKDLNKTVASLKKIEVPVETKGLLDFLKRGKK